ncbi:MAG: L-serine ammonia-lyase, iron-sulfur-dependent, subunit alpha [Oscillospiraceae bacterium]
MEKNCEKYKMYLNILKEELIPAMGCTEPIALSLAASICRDTLNDEIVSIKAAICGNIIKNVKSVIVPNTSGLKGIEAAIAAGVIAGKSELKLEVLSLVSQKEKEEISEFIKKKNIKIVPATCDKTFYIEVEIIGKNHSASVTIEDSHTNITKIIKDGKTLFSQNEKSDLDIEMITDRKCLNVKDIVEFADIVDLSDIKEIISRQIDFNKAISEEGLKNHWGAQIGRILLSDGDNSIATRARAAAAAGSDARMSGCEMPVVIVSGSGNQGITASIPVIVYAKELNSTSERLYKALVISNLISIYQKTGIGQLSAFCGAVCAGCGAAAGIAYLYGDGYDVIKHTIVNTLAITSGMVCDGAKASCAAKISSAVDAGILGYRMYKEGQQFYSGDGVVGDSVDHTIENIGRVARDGMKETDREIINIMTGN